MARLFHRALPGYIVVCQTHAAYVQEVVAVLRSAGLDARILDDPSNPLNAYMRRFPGKIRIGVPRQQRSQAQQVLGNYFASRTGDIEHLTGTIRGHVLLSLFGVAVMVPVLYWWDGGWEEEQFVILVGVGIGLFLLLSNLQRLIKRFTQ